MTIRTAPERAEAVGAMDELLFEARTAGSMNLDQQWVFDELVSDIEAYDADVAAAAATAAQVERALATVPESAPLAAKFGGVRNISSDAERAIAVTDMGELADEHRGYAMPVDAQRAFDMLILAIDSYDAEASIRASTPSDPRDAILAEMRERAGNGPLPANAIPSYQESLLAAGSAFRRGLFV